MAHRWRKLNKSAKNMPDRGFEAFYDSIEFGTRKQHKILTHIRRFRRVFNVLKRGYAALTSERQPHATADEVNKRVLSWVRNCSNTFFLWIHYMDVHAPYTPPLQYVSEPMTKHEKRALFERLVFHQDELTERDIEKVISLYDGEIRYIDDAIKSLLAGIGEEILKNTLVVITSDHGDEFGEHGGFLHSAKLYDELIHVPLIMLGQGLNRKVVTDVVSLLDVAPTILDFLDIEKPGNFQGSSLFSREKKNGIISEVSHKGNGEIKFDLQERQISYRTKKWKYIYKGNGSCELYNLKNDPREMNSVADEDAEKAEEFRSVILEHIRMQDTTRESARLEELRIKRGIKRLKASGEI